MSLAEGDSLIKTSEIGVPESLGCMGRQGRSSHGITGTVGYPGGGKNIEKGHAVFSSCITCSNVVVISMTFKSSALLFHA